MTAKHPMIPFPVIVRAADGDIEAVNQIVRHYSGFIASRSMRPIFRYFYSDTTVS